MTRPAAYAIEDDVLSSHYDDESVLVHLHSKRCFRLNATAAEVWRGLERGLSPAAISERLCARFDIDRDNATSEAQRLLAQLEGARLIRAVA